MALSYVGKSMRRKEGPQKLCGQAKYIDDHVFPGGLFGVTYRSSIAHGRIKKINFDPSFDWREFIITQAQDIPGKNEAALLETDQPLLADQLIKHHGEAILLVAHRDPQQAYEALKHIQVTYEELPPVLDMEKSTHVFKKFLISKGDVDEGFKKADFIVEGQYRVGHQEHAYIENNGMASYFDGDTLVIVGSLQCPYYVQKALKHIFGLNDQQLRVVQTTTGGGFGGKEDYPNLIGGHAALLAWKSKKPVKMIYDRHEDMAATTKRHPAVIRHKTGLTKTGKILAQDITIIMDGGAYVTLSPVVLSRGTLHATGPYECPNIRVSSKVVQTNTPPNGAFRGFGAPQTLFAAELHIEKIARELGLDSLKLRRLNILKKGSLTATGGQLNESVGASECLERTVKKSHYARKRKEYDRWNKNKNNPTWKGMGLALAHHGAGFTGSGEVYLASEAGVGINRNGQIQVLAASTEIGQGTNSMFAQIASETLGLPYDWIEVANPDTAVVPNSGPTVASRTCMIVGNLVAQASLELKRELEKYKPPSKTWTRDLLKSCARQMLGSQTQRSLIVKYQQPPEIQWDDATYKGDAYGVYSYGCVAVDLEIDKLTYEVRLNSLTTTQDIGKAINPLLAQGQIAGGTVQGIGYALLENVIMKNGSMQNAQLTNYIIPTFLDTPPMTIEIAEKPYSRGPFGAKGVGELPLGIPGPAIASAVMQASNCLISELPILPEKIYEAYHQRKKEII